MTDLKITQETTRTPIDGTELVRLATTGANWKASLSAIFGTLSQASAWNYVNTNITAVANQSYLVDTTGGSITLTLPATPSVGNAVSVANVTNAYPPYTLTVARNGSNISSTADDFVCDTNAIIRFIYVNVTIGWMVNLNALQ